MVCFSIQVAHRKSDRQINDLVTEKRLKHLCHHMVSTLFKKEEEETTAFYLIHTCDEEAVALLRDLPQPIHVVHVQYLHDKTTLYQNRHYYKNTPRIYPPRKNPILKDVYWLAMSCERRLQTPAQHVSKYPHARRESNL